MARQRSSVPPYQRHSSGKARVRTYDSSGKRGEIVLPGPYGSNESKAEYARVVVQLANGKGTLPAASKPNRDCTITELVLAYMAHAESYYVDPVTKEPTSEQTAIKDAWRPLVRLFGSLPVEEFDSLRLEAIQLAKATGSTLTDKEREVKGRRPLGMARSTINRHIDRIKRMMRWGCAKKIVPPHNLVNIEAVASLKAGRCDARETEIVKPIDHAIVETTLPLIAPAPADMVRVMLLSGCRVGELCKLRGRELDRSGDQWVYAPDRHKTAHRGHVRAIVFGPQAMLILRAYLKADPDAYLFSPPAVASHHRNVRRRHTRRRRLALDQRQRLIRLDRGLTLGQSFRADAMAHALHLLRRHLDLGQFRQVFAALCERRTFRAGIDDLVQHRVAVFAPINPQALALREKKTADIFGSIRGAHPKPLRPLASRRYAVRGPAWLRPDVDSSDMSERFRGAVRLAPGVRAPGPAFYPRAPVLPR